MAALGPVCRALAPQPAPPRLSRGSQARSAAPQANCQASGQGRRLQASQLAAAARRRRRSLPPPAAAASPGSGSSDPPAPTEEDLAEQWARAVAALAAQTFLRDEITVGMGTGLAVNCLIEELAGRLKGGKLRSVRVVPASNAAAAEAALHGVPLATLQDAGGRLDFFFECADELANDEEGTLGFIVGRRQKPTQPQLHRARELAVAATTNVALAADPLTVVPRLGGSLPVAIQEEGWEDIAEQLDDIFLGDAELWRRSTEEGAGPRGGDAPYVSQEGHALIDVRFYEGLKLYGEDADYGSIAREIEGVEGVVAHGLMANVAAAAIVAGGETGEPRLAWRGEPWS